MSKSKFKTFNNALCKLIILNLLDGNYISVARLWLSYKSEFIPQLQDRLLMFISEHLPIDFKLPSFANYESYCLISTLKSDIYDMQCRFLGITSTN